MIYLDYNATTPLHPLVLEAMVPYLKDQWANPSSPYRFGSVSRAAVDRARESVADCLGCLPGEIVFCSSGTESDNLAIRGTVAGCRNRCRHIITSSIEHPAVLKTCQSLERDGCEVTCVPVSPAGVIDIAKLVDSIRPQTTLITVMHANNETGVLQPIEEIAAIAKKHRILFHVDAVQTAGKHPLKLSACGADLVSFSAHKFSGPKGAAALYVRQGTAIAPTMTGGLQEWGLRAGTENVAGIIGLAEALTLSCEGLETEIHRQQVLRDRLELDLQAKIPSIQVNGQKALRVANTSNISFQSVDGESIVLALGCQGFCLATGSACSTSESEPSHVLLAMGLSPLEAQSSVRISFGRDTHEEHLQAATVALSEAVTRLRSISSI